jgi:hypothetical protein
MLADQGHIVTLADAAAERIGPAKGRNFATQVRSGAWSPWHVRDLATRAGSRLELEELRLQ